MTEQDYINSIKCSNTKLFRDPQVRVNMPITSVEKIIRDAYRAGAASEREKKSLFEQVFGMSRFWR